MQKRIQIIVSGRVQGVFFRANTQETAQNMGIVGSVKNLQNGSVQIEAQGDEETLAHFLLWVKEGPPMATVTDVQTIYLEIDPHLNDFKVT